MSGADQVADQMKKMFKEVEYQTSVSMQTGDQLFQLLGYCGRDPKADQMFIEAVQSSESDVNVRNDEGATLLIVASYYMFPDIVEVLLKAKSDPNALNQIGSSALHYACSEESFSLPVATLLIRYKADVNLQEKSFGCTPLHYAAAIADNSKMLGLLTRHGASLSIADSEGYHPTDYAHGHEGNTKFLSEVVDVDPSESKTSFENNPNVIDEWANEVENKTPKTNKLSKAAAAIKGNSLASGAIVAFGGKTPHERSLFRGFAYSMGARKVAEKKKKTAKELQNQLKKLRAQVASATEEAVNMKANAAVMQSISEKLKAANKELNAQKKKLAASQKKLEAGAASTMTEAEFKEKLSGLDKVKAGHEATAKGLKDEISKLQADATDSKMADATKDLTDQLDALRKRVVAIKKKVETDTMGNAKLKADIQKQKAEITNLNEHVEALKHGNAEIEEHNKEVQVSAQALIDKEVAKERELWKQRKQKEKQIMKLETESIIKERERLTVAYLQEQKVRRKLYNELEDMKGKIRVYCRIRPMNGNEKKKKCGEANKVVDEYTVNVDPCLDPASKKKGKGWIKFEFDKAFGPTTAQSAVFADTKRLMQSAADGFNVCIFAYGQTGSGKTWTMMGKDSDPDLLGISPRAVNEIYDIMERDKDKFSFKVSFSMYELYRDNLVDLLHKKGKRKKLMIKLDSRGSVVVEGGIIKEVHSAQELQATMDGGMNTRHVAATNMNAESSRSHLCQIIFIQSTNLSNNVARTGKLTLVDLAGSERAGKTGASGDTMKEAQSINKSLSALGNVISALTTGSKHVPYRDSQLTQLMKDSLGGNAKTLMFVNCSPADYNASESYSSLQFAQRCKKVVNNASAQIETAQLKKLKAEIARLKHGGGPAAGGGGAPAIKRPKRKKKKKK